jgi:hypothetical protein
VNFFSSSTIWMRPVKSSSTAWPEATPFVPFASKLLAGPDVGDNLLMADALLARTGDVGCWIVLIPAVVVGDGDGVSVT